MDDISVGHAQQGAKHKPGRLKVVWVTIEYLSVRFAEWMGAYLSVMGREFELFLGTGLLLLGLLNFSSDKFCDGNTADYLSCTRPSTYYYYGWLEIALIILGVFLILLWRLRRTER